MRIDGKRLWLCVPFAVVFLVDLGVTLAGQPREYWAGDHSRVEEMFPVFAWGLSHGLWTAGLVCVAWVVVFSVLIVMTPAIIGEVLSLALVSGHTWGAMTWLVYRVQLDYHLCLLYFVFTAGLFVVCDRRWRGQGFEVDGMRGSRGRAGGE